MIFRNFLYLNTPTVNNYLSTIHGYQELEAEETTTTQKSGGAKLNVHVAEGTLGGDHTASTKRKFATTPEGNFQNLFELINENREVPLLEAFDLSIWRQLNRGDFIELQATASVPEIVATLALAQDFDPYLKVAQMFGQISLDNPADAMSWNGVLGIGEIVASKPLPLILKPVGSPQFSFFSDVNRDHLSVSLNQLLSGEVTVFGKITRKLEKGRTETVYDLLPLITNLSGLNRQKRRQMQKNQDFSHKLKGPAAILDVVAIYR